MRGRRRGGGREGDVPPVALSDGPTLGTSAAAHARKRRAVRRPCSARTGIGEWIQLRLLPAETAGSVFRRHEWESAFLVQPRWIQARLVLLRRHAALGLRRV